MNHRRIAGRLSLLALALSLAAPGWAQARFASSFEEGEPALARQTDAAVQLNVGNGPAAPYAAKPGSGYSGLHALEYRGSAGRVRLFDVDVLVQADTELSWLVLPEVVDSDTVASTYVSLDAVLDDGSRVSAGPARDQYGFALGAQAQGDSKSLYPQQWARKAVRLGDVPGLRGRRVVAIELELRPPAGTQARGWLDDVALGAVDVAARRAPSDWVLTTRGTQSNGTFSRGNNFPATAVPHGFNFWTPVTDAGTLGWLYSWNERNDAANRPRLQAFSLSHQPSPWMGDRQTFQVMPSLDKGVPEADRGKRALAFSHAAERARPQEYRVRFDNGIDVALAPTDHAALFEFAFPEGGDANLLFDNVDARGGLTLDAASGTLSGYTDVRSGLSNGATRMYVYASFDRPWQGSGAIQTGRPTGYIKFAAGTRSVRMRIATSLISVAQARHNLALELAAGDTVERVAARAQQQWDALLGTVQVEGASDDQRTTLYSNLYRLSLYPNSGSENVGSAERPDWRYANQISAAQDATDGSARRSYAGIRDGQVYLNNGLWDTFRTAWPGYGLLDPAHAGGLIGGFLEQYRAGGWVARWSSPGYADLMVGTSSDVAFADAWAKGIDGFDAGLAYEAALKNATVVPPDAHVGRKGMARSMYRGYADTDTGEGMSWTLEGALNDFGIATLAQDLSTAAASARQRQRYAEEAEYFRYRAADYANLFDPAVGFFQGRKPDGNWRSSAQEYDPRVWGPDYTESSGWTFAFTAAHDGNGLAALYGGRQQLADKLDAFFALPATATLAISGRGYIIHEMTEARDVRMGMYAHSNQTAHHIPWMYLYAGQPWKTQALTRQVLQRLYLGSDIGQGYPGDEDNGEMSAWYVLASMGLYPLRMGSPDYVIGSPLFKQFALALPGGKRLRVRAPDNSPENVYVQSLKVNGKPWSKTWIPHRLLAQGATLDFEMGPKPSRWGSRPEDAPPSLTAAGRMPATLADAIDAQARVVASGADEAGALVDDDADTGLTLAGKEPTVQITLARAARPVFYTLTSGDRPIPALAWTLEARQGDGAWQVLDRRDGEDFRWTRQLRPFRIAHPGSYDQYRLRFDGAGRAALAEIELLQVHEPVAAGVSRAGRVAAGD